MKNPLIPCLSVGLLASAGLWADTIIDGYSDATNDRFTNDPAFILSGHSLAAVGKSGARWGTLVADNVIMSAYHFRPIIGQQITFYATNDPNGATETRTIVADYRFGNTDIWLGILNRPMPPDYAPLSFATENIKNSFQFNNSIYAGANAYLIGVSPTSPNVALDTSVGRNELTDWVSNFTTGSTTGNAIRAYYNQELEPEYVTYEAYLQTFDSGAPLLVEIGGELRIVGFNWYINPSTVPIPQYSGIAYVGNFGTEIQAIIDAFEGSNAPAAYFTWANSAFDGETALAVIGPNNDNDHDGLTNYDEFALVYDPLVYDHRPAGVATIINQQVELTLELQENDDALNYRIQTSSDLLHWSSSSLSYNSGNWSSSHADVATVVAQSDHGSSWTVTVRDATAVSDGAGRFLQLAYD